jgi:hypothetical protein
MTYLNRSLSEGIETGEFTPVPLEETATLILSVINGIVRYRGINKNMREAAVDFCRRSLMNGKYGHSKQKNKRKRYKKGIRCELCVCEVGGE